MNFNLRKGQEKRKSGLCVFLQSHLGISGYLDITHGGK